MSCSGPHFFAAAAVVGKCIIFGGSLPLALYLLDTSRERQ